MRNPVALVSEQGNYMLNIAAHLGLLQIAATPWQWQIKFPSVLVTVFS